MFEPLWWYMEQMEMVNEAVGPPPIQHDTIGAGQTPWLYLALDFRFTMGVKLCQSIEDEEKISLASQAKYFVKAFRTIYRRRRVEWNLEVIQQPCTLQGLDMPKSAGLKGRVVLASPEKVNKIIHQLAIKIQLFNS